MKRCPKCNRTYKTDTQKFCTHDGGILEGIDMGHETIRLDSSQPDADVPTKEISGELLTEVTGEFDPYKTVMSRPEGTVADEFDPFKTVMSHPDGTVADQPRDARNIPPRSTILKPTAQPPSVPPPGSAQVSQSPPESSVPPPSTPQLTQRLIDSGPITSSAPLPQPQVARSAPRPPAAPPAKRKSRFPWC